MIKKDNMKLIANIIPGLLLFAMLLLQSCSKEDEPFYTVKGVIVDTTKRSVLLEDYTGHTCVNCAPAAEMANTIQETYAGQVYVIAVHAGNFAKPNNDPKYYPYLLADYRCETSNDWYGYSAFNIDQNPKGMVNRRPFNNNMSFGTSDWNEAVKVAVTLPKIAVMTLHNNFNSADSMLSVNVGVKYLTDYTGQVSLTVCLVEDEIHGGQLNIIKPDSVPIIKNFTFMHIMRGSLNGSFGEQVSSGPKKNSLLNKSYSMDFKSKGWIPANCAVIAFISDVTTKEVLHVTKARLSGK